MCAHFIIGLTDFVQLISWKITEKEIFYFSVCFDVISRFRFVEKGNLEVLLFTLQSKMRANNQKPYTPKEGKMISDINKAWERLEKAEHERELALREELIRQEKLEQLAARFNRKASMRETWLSENQRLVSQVRCASSIISLRIYFINKF